jgi:hypothetical protein
MSNYKTISIDLAKRKFHLAVLDEERKVVIKKAIMRKDFFDKV